MSPNQNPKPDPNPNRNSDPNPNDNQTLTLWTFLPYTRGCFGLGTFWLDTVFLTYTPQPSENLWGFFLSDAASIWSLSSFH